MIAHARTAKPYLGLTLAMLVLAGCNTWANPANWFGGSEEIDVETGEINPLVPGERDGLFSRPDYIYPGVPVDQVTELRIERTRSGAIILAQGVASRQGPHEVRLIPESIDEEPIDGVLAYSFNIVYPDYNTAVGPVSTRTVTAARSISTEVLAKTRVVRVVAAGNIRESRR